MTVSEKAAYLKGLAEGLGVDDSTKEGKLMLAMIDVIDALAHDVEAVEATAADLADSIDDIGDDMAYLEDLCYENLNGDDGDGIECDGDCSCCSGCGSDMEYEVVCPECGETVTAYEDDLEFGSMPCPFCNAEIEFDLDEEEEDEED